MDASQAMFISQNHNLVACFNLIETYQSMGRIIPHIMENKKRSKPPTSD
jgi:hypothetical protein